jgi:hypothetical protein
MEMVAVNMPGTDREHPNRRRKLRLPVQTPRLDRPKRSSKRSGANAKRRPAPGRAVNMDKEHVKGAARQSAGDIKDARRKAADSIKR